MHADTLLLLPGVPILEDWNVSHCEVRWPGDRRNPNFERDSLRDLTTPVPAKAAGVSAARWQLSVPLRLLLSAPPVIVEAVGSGEASTTTGSGESSQLLRDDDKDGSNWLSDFFTFCSETW